MKRAIGAALLGAALCFVGGPLSRPRPVTPPPPPPAQPSSATETTRPVVAKPVKAATAVIENAVPLGGTVIPRRNLTALVMAEEPGVVAKLCVKEGQRVAAGQVLALVRYDSDQPPAPVLQPQPVAKPIPAPPTPPAVTQAAPADQAAAAGQDDAGPAFHLTPPVEPAPPAEASPRPAVTPPPPPPGTPVTSPLAGVVVKLYPRAGERVEADFPMVAAVMDTRQVELVATAGPAAAAAVGRRVLLNPPDGGRAVRGRVTQVSRGGDGRTLVTVVIPNPRGRLKAGMVLEGKVRLGPSHRAVMVPWRAICRDGAERSVLVVEPSGAVRSQPVTLGRRQGYLIEVKTGLQPGQQVLVVGNYHQ